VLAEDGLGHSASYVVDLDDLTYDPDANMWSWDLAGPYELKDGDTVVATLNSGNCGYVDDPVIFFGFSVLAGNTDTTFTITSATLSFANMNPASAQASAGFSLTDAGGGGSLLSGLLGGMGYEADYNGATVFTQLVASYGTGGGQTIANADNIGPLPLANVFDMTSKVKFKLSANDLASGTNVYVIVPEPSMFAVAGVGALALLRRRRNK